MFFDQTIKLTRPTDSRQLLHLIDMGGYFDEEELDCRPIEEAMLMNYGYGISHTKNFDEFCDLMHTCIYWLNENYSYLCVIDNTADVINMTSGMDRGEELDDEIYRWDIITGAWLSFIVQDTPKIRQEFISLYTSEDEILRLLGVALDCGFTETFCFSWIKEIVDPCRAAAFGHYMMYFMMRYMNTNGDDEKDKAISDVLTRLFILTCSASRMCALNKHNLHVN